MNENVPSNSNENQENLHSEEVKSVDKSTNATEPAQTSSSFPKEDGILASSWKDIAKSKGWLVKIFQLMIMGLIPFVNLFVNGYILDWSQTLMRGTREVLPKRAFNSKAFITGFLYWVVTLVCWFSSLILLVFLPIPVLGVIIIFILNTFITAYAMIAGIRMALYNRFTAAFDLSEIWNVMRKDLGSLFLAIFVPAIIVVVIAIVLAIILVLCGFGAFATSSATRALSGSSGALGYGLVSNPYTSYLGNNLLTLFAQIASAVLPLFIIFIIIFGMLAVFMNIWQMRAVAHWLRKNAPEWVIC